MNYSILGNFGFLIRKNKKEAMKASKELKYRFKNF
jgi:hypothetical protein